MSWPRLRLLMIGLAIAMGIMLWVTTPTSTPPEQPEQAAKKKEKRRAPETRNTIAAAHPLTEEVADLDPAEDQPMDTVTCTVADEASFPGRVRPRLISMSDDGEGFSLTQTDSSVILKGMGQHGTIRLHMRGHPSVDVSWENGQCEPIVFGPTATVYGHVRNAYLQGTRRTNVSGCGARTRVEEDGSFELQINPELCELAAKRWDGPLLAVSEPVFLEPEPGDVLEVELALPAYRMAGVGFSWQLVEGGVEVVSIHADTPASDEGLQAGDVILLVDDESTEDMNRGDVRRTIGGKPGTDVSLLVLRGDGEVSLRFSRESLDHALPEPEHHGKWGKRPH